MDASPPSAPEAQKIVLAAVLLSEHNGDETCRRKVFGGLRAADWIGDDRGIFAAMARLYAAGKPLEIGAVVAEAKPVVPDVMPILRDAGALIATTASVGHYVDLIKDASVKRQVFLAATDLRNRSLNGCEPGELIADWRATGDDLQGLTDDTVAPIAMFDNWAQSVRDRETPRQFLFADYGSSLQHFPIAEGLVNLLGAPPGAGKTAYVSQCVVEALRRKGQEDVRALIANVEMSPQVLLDRQVARISGVPYGFIRRRDFDDHAMARIEASIAQLRAIMSRLTFMGPPFTLDRLVDQVDATEANIVVLDYAQRFDFAQRSGDARAQISGVMDVCRRIADQGRAVIVISAVNRQGYSKDTASIASFRESSELEYGADAAFLLISEGENQERATLKTVKNRHGSLCDIRLKFDGGRQEFTDDRDFQEWTC